MTSSSLPTFEEKLRAATKMPPPHPEFVSGLRARLLAQPPRRVSVDAQPLALFRRPAWAVVVIMLLVAAFLIAGPERVLAAVRQWLGYIPDVGIVDRSSPLRVLAEPISVTRDGISITVTSAVLTGDRTHVDYRIFGVPGSAYPDREDVVGCILQPYLRLPDGTRLVPENDFPPVPAGVGEAILVLPCISNTLPGTTPENWELPLRFAPAPLDLTVVPIIESLPSQTPSVIAEANTPVPEANPLVITQALDVGDRFVLMGEFNLSTGGDASLPAGSWWAINQISIRGADGREVPQTYSNDFQPPGVSRPDSETWLYELEKNFVPPVTITYTGEIISPVGAKEQVEFEFDAGTNPQDNGVLEINKDFSLGGYNLRLISVEANSSGYSFHFKADPGASANAIQVDIVGYSPNCGGGGGGGNPFSEEFNRTVCYAAIPGGPAFPGGKLKVVVSFQALARQSKSFQVQWSPDAAQPGSFVTSTPQPGVCLAADALARLNSLPALAGVKALVYENLADTGTWGLALYTVNGEQVQHQVVTPAGNWGAISPDGSRVAYSGLDGGIRIVDLAAQTEQALPGVTGYDIHWSPDGKQIAYIGSSDGGSNSVFVASAGDGQTRRVSEWNNETVIGWSPDGARLYFAAPFTGGAAWKVYSFDLAGGVAQERFIIENGTPKFLDPVLSPDGNWIAYRGRDNSSVYLARTDGSDMRLLLDNAGAGNIEWSRSGWLGVSLRKDDISGDSWTAIINPNGCEAYLLPENVRGSLEGLFVP